MKLTRNMNLRLFSDLRIKQYKYSPYPEVVRRVFSPLRRRVTKKGTKDSEPPAVNLPPSIVITRSISTCDFVSDGSSADFNDNISVLVADGHVETYITQLEEDDAMEGPSPACVSTSEESRLLSGNTIMVATVTYNFKERQNQLNQRSALEQLRTHVTELETERARLRVRLDAVTKRLEEARAAEKVRLAKGKVARWRLGSEGTSGDRGGDERPTPVLDGSKGGNDRQEGFKHSPQISEATLFDQNVNASVAAECGYATAAVKASPASSPDATDKASDPIQPSPHSSLLAGPTTPITLSPSLVEDDTTAVMMLSCWEELLSKNTSNVSADTPIDSTYAPLARSQSLAQLALWGTLAQQRRMRTAIAV